MYGRIVSDWKMEGGQFSLRATIPANTTATVYIPTQNANGVLESGASAANAKGVKFLRKEADATVYAVDSGTYEFTAQSAASQPDR